ncbi:gliding motility-associated C-terminal domain-containing protein [Flaviaesturariibacter amylovorans]|uniref:PKD domain-containing protein n=1 Tax=Flaviaesturariibacter amylovorans TaxID=1084520 RepID=A0ABP8G8T4_9BACT
MKRLLVLLLLVFAYGTASADHLKGGFFTYRYLGPGDNDPSKNAYEITLTVYMDEFASNQITTSIPFTIFNADNGTELTTLDASRIRLDTLRKNTADECIINAPVGIFYKVLVYQLPMVELSPNNNGWVVAYQRCCRISGIANVIMPSNSSGNTYAITIPGRNVLLAAPTNSSAVFLVNDTGIICRNSYFEYDFHGTDPDGDSLSYSFCDALHGGGQSPGGTCTTCPAPNPAAPPPYPVIGYSSGFSGGQPLGPQVSIDPRTGKFSGIAPEVGEYVVTVCVNEYRNGVLIAQTRKELHIKVADCSAVQATLLPQYVNCQDFNVIFNNATPTGVVSSFWDFGVASQTNDTANINTPTFVYPDTGLYVVKLLVNRGEKCADSTTSIVRVYPGFFPGFEFSGICANKPTQFRDTTKTNHGFVDKWFWNFGDPTTLADTSLLKLPQYTYGAPATYTVTFTVGTNKGCSETITKTVTIMDKPPLTMAFSDTLICKGDTLQLGAAGDGIFTWTPAVNISGANTPSPRVWPATTRRYYVQLDQNGCLNHDSVDVNVVEFVTLNINPDTTICLTDSVRLGAQTDGLRFEWTPGEAMDDPGLLTPVVLPGPGLNTYRLTAYIGHCSATQTMRVRTVPYPQVRIQDDTTICFRASLQLNGVHDGNRFEWSPTTWMTNPQSATPTVRPPDTTQYVFTVWNTSSGCPKPRRDTITVGVMPRIYPWAGNDTMVVAGQPVQLLATGGVRYQWLPALGLDNPNIANPVGFYSEDPEYINYIVRVFDPRDCVDSARLRVRVFRTEPWIFVPTAFTPNGDGRNDVVRPIAVGMRKIEWFRVFNRWGQLVFETQKNGHGWDGTIKGKDQGSNVFVWVVKAVDFKGKEYFAKGTVTLIR